MIYWKFKYSRTQRALVVGVSDKMVDENIIPVDWNESNMGIIAKNINSLIYHDCVKEEKEIVDKVGETFGKLCGSTCMRIVKEILYEK